MKNDRVNVRIKLVVIDLSVSLLIRKPKPSKIVKTNDTSKEAADKTSKPSDDDLAMMRWVDDGGR